MSRTERSKIEGKPRTQSSPMTTVGPGVLEAVAPGLIMSAADEALLRGPQGVQEFFKLSLPGSS